MNELSVLLTFSFLSEILTDQGKEQGVLNELQTIHVEEIRFDDERSCYVADCFIESQYIH